MKIIGHRGAAALAPENTLAAIQKSIDHKVDEVEFDVRITRNGIPVLHHDAAIHYNTERQTIAKHTLVELRKYKADLATLEEALLLIGKKTRAQIEIKPDESVLPVVSVIKKLITSGKQSAKNILVASKSQTVLVEFHKLMPEIELVVVEPWSGVRARLRADQVETKRISMNQMWLWLGFIKAIHRGGYKLSAYTVNNPQRAAKWAPYLYGIITDNPELVNKKS